MAVSLATLAAVLTLDATGFTKGAKDASSAADGMAGKLSGVAQSATVGFAAIGAAAVGVGVALYSVGSEFDAAYDKIRVGTGKTGEALEQLEGSFKAVVSTVPASFEDASTAITLLNQRLGLTGEPLEMLSEDFLDLSRITGEDLTTSIQTMTRVFGDWNIKDQVSAMDEMFRASQATGVGMSKLSEEVVQFGAPLRGLGFGFEESVAMLGKWEKEGVNVENVMGAMKKAYGQFSKEFGAKAPEEFRRFVDQISKAPSAAAAAGIAIEKLGVRNGPDFAAAVKEGRFAYGDLVDKIKNGSDTIGQAGADTEDFAEKWKVFTNRMKVAAEPLANQVFGAVGRAMDAISPYAETLAKWLGEELPKAMKFVKDRWDELKPALVDGANRIKDAFEPMGEKVKGVFQWLIDNDGALHGAAVTVGTVLAGAFVALGVAAWSAAAPVVTALAPILAVAAVIGLLAGALVFAYKNWDTFHDAVNRVRDGLVRFYNEALVPAYNFLKDKFPVVWDEVKRRWEEAQPVVSALKDAVKMLYEDAIKPMLEFISTHQEQVKNLLVLFGIAVGLFAAAAFVALTLVGAMLFLMGVIGAVAAIIVGAFLVALMLVIQVVWDVFNNVRDALGGVIDWIENVIQVGWDLAQNIGSAIADAVRFVWGLYEGVLNVAGGVQSKIGEIIGWFWGLGGRILDALGSFRNLLWDSGVSLLEGLWDGISSKVGWLKDRVSGVLGSIRNLFPFSPAKEGPFSGRGWTGYSGQALAEDFAKGITMGAPKVMNATKGLMVTAQHQFGLADAAAEVQAALARTGGHLFDEDNRWTFAGMSDAFASGGWGQKLADMFFAGHPGWDFAPAGDVNSFLGGLANQAPATPQNAQVTFNGDTDSAFATAFQKLVRTGQIQIVAA